MGDFTESRVLKQFEPFLRFLSAYDRDHFRDKNWRAILNSGLYAFGVALFMILLFICFALIAWDLLENFEWTKCAADVPILVTLIQLGITFVVMVVKRYTVAATIKQLQRAVDQREFIWFCMHW